MAGKKGLIVHEGETVITAAGSATGELMDSTDWLSIGIDGPQFVIYLLSAIFVQQWDWRYILIGQIFALVIGGAKIFEISDDKISLRKKGKVNIVEFGIATIVLSSVIYPWLGQGWAQSLTIVLVLMNSFALAHLVGVVFMFGSTVVALAASLFVGWGKIGKFFQEM